jgi:flagellar biosynthetic protein FliP
VVTARLDIAAKRGGVRRDLSSRAALTKGLLVGLFVLATLLLGAGRSSAQTVTPTPSAATTIAPVSPVTPAVTALPNTETTATTETPGQVLSDLTSPTSTTSSSSGALSNQISLVLLIGALSIVPALLITITAFTRIVVVLGLTRSALGTNGVPPTQVLIGLSLFLTLFVMAPQISQANKDAVQPFLKGEISQSQAFDKGMEPFREFMLKNVREKDLSLFVDLSKQSRPAKPEDVPTTTLVPAFVISELRAAFLIGFVVFIPFIVIDLVVSAALSALGMAMLPPSLVSLPFKLLLFVAVDGWYLLASSLVRSFH